MTLRLRQPAKRVLFRVMAPVEMAMRRDYQLTYPPGFVVGPPRSGTTLIRTLLSTGLKTSYFSNLTASTAFALGRPLPATTSWLARRLGVSGGFRSEYGRIDGPGAPAEGEVIWQYWFGNRHDPVAPGQLSDEQSASMYRGVAAAEHMLRAPFINKTTTLALRVEALVDVFENAYFLRVHRDPIDTAQSIYIARTSKYPDWIGARPPECLESDDDDLVNQVAKQVFYINRRLDASAEAVGNTRFLDVDYSKVCHEPRSEFERIREFLDARGVRTEKSGRLPNSFRWSHGQKVDDVTYTRLARALEALSLG